MSEYATRDLHHHYRKNKKSHKPISRRLKFAGIEGLDIYNLTTPFLLEDEHVLAARGEPRENHQSRVFLFRKKGHTWYPHPDWEPIAMEDPFFFHLKEVPYLGGVETFPDAAGDALEWRTVVYNISSLSEPQLVFRGPIGMKDIRFIEYSDGTIGVFTRPQGGAAGRGTCGYLETDNIATLTPEELEEASLLSAPDEYSWEGINQPILLEEDKVGLLGHVAGMGKGEVRSYYAAVSEFSRKKRKKKPWRIIAERQELPPGPAKREDLMDVIFPGGITFESPERALLYLGVSDAEAWTLEIPNPFVEEKKKNH
jgi:hypothetical protein